MVEKNKKKCINDLTNIIIVGLLCLLAIKKGGFYKSDTLFFNLIIQIICGIKIIVYRLKKRECKIDIVGLLLLFLCISYSFAIIFKNYANLSDSIFEMIRYFNVYLIYNVVRYSSNKKIYIIRNSNYRSDIKYNWY